MKILQVHNKYIKRGGEESVIDEEKRVLQDNGHSVIQFIKNSKEIDGLTKFELAGLFFNQRRSTKIKNEFQQLITIEPPDVCHVHNVYPLITPVVYEVCQAMEIPVVQTLHNYKMICTSSLLFREGEVCEKCMSKSLYNSIKHKCYKNSYIATGIQADSIQYHRGKQTWNKAISRYVCLTEFQRGKLVEGGMDFDKMVVKPNFLQNIDYAASEGNYFLFVGRLDKAKGLDFLIELFKRNTTSQFKLIGECDDPSIFSEFNNVEYLGPQERSSVQEYIAESKAIIFPSKYYEGMPMVILEAFSFGKPVVAHNIGAMSSMINHEVNGLKFENVVEFDQAIQRLEVDDELYKKTSGNALKDFEQNYNAQKGYENLINLYNEVIA
jgi:glycosyltransferase involved in cell wall biosynthesis